MTTIPTAVAKIPKGLFQVMGVIGALILSTPILCPPGVASASPAESLEIPLAPPGDPSWKPLLFRSIERPTRFDVESDPDGRPAFRATSDCGASALLLQLPEDFDLTKTPRLAWRWRIEQGIQLEAEDEQSKAGDDFAARVYVLHRFDAERATAWQRMEHTMGGALFGAETPGETINYVWADQTPQGQTWTSPSRDEAKLLALETGSSEEASSTWREAIVDLPRDARRLFSPPPRKSPYAIGLMSDADGVCQRTVAWFSDFRLLGPASESPKRLEFRGRPEATP